MANAPHISVHASPPAKPLKRGANGPEVIALQTQLSDLGYYFQPTGHFGDLTEWALRDFQKKQGLPPSGVVDQRTKDELAHPGSAHANVMETIMHLKVPPATMFAALLKRNVGQSKHLITMHTSPKMFDRLYAAEGGSRKEARFLYWPGGRSGVTIGAGYDMSGRPESAIVKDLTAIGVDAVTAGKVAKCAGASGQTGVNTATRVINAKQFVDDNKNLLDLSPDRQKALFLRILPQYEGHVRSAVHVPLLQNEFDALVSFDYNCPAGMAAIGPKINNGEITKALQSMEQYLVHGMKYQDDRPRLALAGRRHHEVTYYLTGEF